MAATYGGTRASIVESMLRLPRARREERESQRARRGEALVLRPAADGLPLEPAGLQPLVREPPPARDRARDGDEAAHPPPRRAGCRDEPGRDARDHGAHRPAARGRRATRSSSSSTTCTSSRGSRTASSRSTTARRSRRGRSSRSRRIRESSRRTSARRRRSGNERGDERLGRTAPARRDQHVLRPDAHPPGREPAGRRRASSCACSAGTRPGSRRR